MFRCIEYKTDRPTCSHSQFQEWIGGGEKRQEEIECQNEKGLFPGLILYLLECLHVGPAFLARQHAH